MFEKILSFLGLLDKADIIYENVREEKKENEKKEKKDYNFSDGEGFPSTKKEAKNYKPKPISKDDEKER